VVDVVELGDARISGREHLGVAAAADLAHRLRGELLGEIVHPFPPRPEVVLGSGRGEPLDRPAQAALESVAVVVDETRRQRPPRQPLSVRDRTDLNDQTVLYCDADAAFRPVGVENQIRDQSAPHDVRREAATGPT
jgi:hypothetical protein